jgi:hypothetical protein
VVEILRFVVVELARRNDLAGDRRFRPVVADHRALDLACRGDRRLDDDLAIVRPGKIHRFDQAGAGLRLGDADARAQVRRLDEHRIAERGFEAGRDPVTLFLPDVAEHHAVRADRQARGSKHHFHDALVHSDRGGEDSRAHVGHVGQLEQSLNGAVLAVGPVQHGEDDVQVQAGDDRIAFGGIGAAAAADRQDRLGAGPRDEMDLASPAARPGGFEPRLLDHFRGRHRCRRAIRQRPAAVLFNADGNRFVSCAVEVCENRRRGCQRHFVFTRASAVKHADTKSLHAKKNTGGRGQKGSAVKRAAAADIVMLEGTSD